VPATKAAVVPLTNEAVPLPVEATGAVTDSVLVSLKFQRATRFEGVFSKERFATELVIARPLPLETTTV
jgi:hypothetical protein